MKKFSVKINGKQIEYENTYLNALAAAEHEKKVLSSLPELKDEDLGTKKDYVAGSEYTIATMKENFQFVANVTGAKEADLQKGSGTEIRDAASKISATLLELEDGKSDGDKNSKK